MPLRQFAAPGGVDQERVPGTLASGPGSDGEAGRAASRPGLARTPDFAFRNLTNVSLTESPAGFTLTDDLAVSFEIANFLCATQTDALRDVGDINYGDPKAGSG
jgi:hypothetical protein